MKNIVGIISIIVGCLFILLNRSLARFIIKQQNKFWNWNWTSREIFATKVILVFLGGLLIVYGILIFLQVIQFK
jgi:hypothetical protein